MSSTARAPGGPGPEPGRKPNGGVGAGQPRKTAVITGVTGQDGSYLAELLLAKGYEVIGVVRRTSHDSYERIGHLLELLEGITAPAATGWPAYFLCMSAILASRGSSEAAKAAPAF